MTYIVAIGGLDPGAGAGLARDLLTANALGAAALLVGTAWTVQSRAGVRGFEPRAAGAVRGAIHAALGEIPPGEAAAVKIGMVAESAVAEAVVAALAEFSGPVVYDPVLAASSGGALYRGDPRALAALMARATLVTPNLGEAARLTGLTVSTPDEARAAGRALCVAGARAVLIKGGHLAGQAQDVLVTGAVERAFSAARVPGKSPRGTGCALATAIAVGLAQGQPLEVAVAEAKTWLLARIQAAVTVGDERRLP